MREEDIASNDCKALCLRHKEDDEEGAEEGEQAEEDEGACFDDGRSLEMSSS